MSIPPEFLVSVLTACVVVMCLIKRLSAFDLELRANRERLRADYWRERSAADISRDISDRFGHEIAPQTVRSVISLHSAEQFEDLLSHLGDYDGGRGRDQAAAHLVALYVDWAKADARSDIPAWALALLDPQDVERCAHEWAAHLHERIEACELRAARADRRVFIRHALVLALTRRMRWVVSRFQ